MYRLNPTIQYQRRNFYVCIYEEDKHDIFPQGQ